MIKSSKSNKASVNWRNLSPLEVLKYTGWGFGILLLAAFLMFLLFPDPFINSLLRDRITKAYNASYPANSLQIGKLHYSVWRNKLECDSIILKSSDHSYHAGLTSIRGIRWMKILWNKEITLNDFRSSTINTEDITITFRQTLKELHLGKLRVSVPDSEIAVDSIKYYSLIDDEKFFAKSKYRQTRFRSDISSVIITGLDWIKMFQGNAYAAKCVYIHDIFTDILVNMDKPYETNSPNPQMPNEFISSIKETINIDSLRIFNGRLKYSERYNPASKPGTVTFNDINMFIRRIVNHSVQSDTTKIIADGLFMNSGKMKLLMQLPLNEKDFSFQYSGSLSSMDASRLNSFIVPGEYHQIKSGILKSASFNINVIKGHANGTLYLAYDDLAIDILNKKTGRESGIIEELSSLFGKLFVVRGSNLPDKNGKMKTGKTQYSRKPDDYFFQFIWFALRNGVGDVVGFPQI